MTGKIIKVFGQIYTVEYGDRSYNCVLRGKIRQDKRLETFSEPAVTGDMVEFSVDDNNEGVIESIAERRNIFSRKENIGSKEDIIASNIDLIVVIQSFKKPRLNLRFVDRLLVRGQKEGIPVVLCVNKCDLASPQELEYPDDYYRDAGITTVKTCTFTGQGIGELVEIIRDRIAVFVGPSGVGKSSIINSLAPEMKLRTSSVSASTGKGKHTTTNVEMVTCGPFRIIDTPGLREFGLLDIPPLTLGNYFPEFRKYSHLCGFRTCSHDHEPDCEVKRQVEAGNIINGRYVSYLNMYYSLKEDYDNLY